MAPESGPGEEILFVSALKVRALNTALGKLDQSDGSGITVDRSSEYGHRNKATVHCPAAIVDQIVEQLKHAGLSITRARSEGGEVKQPETVRPSDPEGDLRIYGRMI